MKIQTKQYRLSRHFSLSAYNPFTLMAPIKEHMKIVAVFPELHPRVNNYDSKHNFVGQCISNEIRNQSFENDAQLKSILDLFPIRDESNQSTSGPKLIYMSLGTIFHSNTFIFDHFIEAIRNYDKKPTLKFKSSQFHAILSVGEQSMELFKNRISSGELDLPKNILIREKVPQLEVLKRAHLFITHSGMNSISETIKYAVPIISIPLEGDQQINGIRSCDELHLGIRLEALKTSAEVFIDTIEKVLGDEKYANSINEMSHISAKYNGRVEATKLIMSYLITFINCVQSNKLRKKLTKLCIIGNLIKDIFCVTFGGRPLLRLTGRCKAKIEVELDVSSDIIYVTNARRRQDITL
ncbi:glycosyl transferase, partial [Brachionus plicatilis]